MSCNTRFLEAGQTVICALTQNKWSKVKATASLNAFLVSLQLCLLCWDPFSLTHLCVCVCETEMLSPSVDLSAATGCCTQGLGASSVG